MERVKRSEWVRRWQQSGLTAKAFAAQAGLNPQTLAHWKWQLRTEERRTSGMPKAAFVEVVMPDSRDVAAQVERQGEGFEVVLTNGRRVRIPARFDGAALRSLLAVLEAA